MTGVTPEIAAAREERSEEQGRDVRLQLSTADPFQDVIEFHRKFELLYLGRPRILPRDLELYRRQFLKEELDEYEQASDQLYMELAFDVIEEAEVTRLLDLQLDALCDLVYVAVGTAQLHGFDFNAAWKRVHAANMTKLRKMSNLDSATIDSGREAKYDVVKPEGFVPPSHVDLVEDHIHRAKG